MLVLGIETSTPQSTVALGTERGTVASMLVSATRPLHDVAMSAVEHLLDWSDTKLSQVGGVAVGLGPGLFTGMRVGIATAKTLAQVLSVPIVGMASLDVMAFAVRHSRRVICAAVDGKRGELFYAFYRPVPGGVARQSGLESGSPSLLAAELQARAEDMLLIGNGALAYRQQLEDVGSNVEFASPSSAFPTAEALVELAIPRFQREEFDRVFDVQPIYLRKSDAEIAWDRRRAAD